MDTYVIPAQPGYHLLNVTYEDDLYNTGGPIGFSKTPVIAWRIINSEYTHPIGDEHSFGDAVLRPDGTVYFNGERPGEAKHFGNETEALQHFTDEYRHYTEKP